MTRRDVRDEAARQANAVRVGGDRRVPQPHDSAVAADDAVLVIEWLARTLDARHLREHALAIVRVDDLHQEAGVGDPFVGAVRGHLSDLRADPGGARDLAGTIDVRCERQRLDERAVALLRLAKLALDLGG